MKNYLRTNLTDAYAESDMAGVNASGGIAVWDIAPQFAMAYNPIIYTRTRYLYVTTGYEAPEGVDILTNGSVTLYRNTEVDTSTFDIYDNSGNLAFSLSAESFNGVTTFDISHVVQTWFNDQLATMNAPVVADKRLFTQYIVKNLGGTGWMRLCVAVNAVAQIGESSDMTDYIGQVLLKGDKAYYYEGYPIDYAVLAQSSVATSQGATPPNSVSRVKVDGTLLELQTEAGVPILTESGEKIYVLPAFNIPIIVRCVPRNPFYVRWVNQIGGVDYWMFGRQQEYDAKVKNVALYERHVSDPNIAKSNRQAYAIDTENRVTVGAEGIPEADYESLRWMPLSPSIEWYNEANGKWVALTIAEYNGVRNTKSHTHNIEITFDLPALNTQY